MHVKPIASSFSIEPAKFALSSVVSIVVKHGKQVELFREIQEYSSPFEQHSSKAICPSLLPAQVDEATHSPGNKNQS